MKKITPKKVPFKKYLEFVKNTQWKPNAKDDEWFVEHRYGWGLSDESAKRFKQLKDDPDPLFLELTDVEKTSTFYRYAIVSDKVKYAITISHQHVKDILKKLFPNFEFDIPEYDGTPDYEPLKNS